MSLLVEVFPVRTLGVDESHISEERGRLDALGLSIVLRAFRYSLPVHPVILEVGDVTSEIPFDFMVGSLRLATSLWVVGGRYYKMILKCRHIDGHETRPHGKQG